MKEGHGRRREKSRQRREEWTKEGERKINKGEGLGKTKMERRERRRQRRGEKKNKERKGGEKRDGKKEKRDREMK